MKSMTYKGFLPAAVIVAHQAVVFALHAITHAFHPLPDQEGFSHCQRQFGRTGTTLESRTHFSFVWVRLAQRYPGGFFIS